MYQHVFLLAGFKLKWNIFLCMYYYKLMFLICVDVEKMGKLEFANTHNTSLVGSEVQKESQYHKI